MSEQKQANYIYFGLLFVFLSLLHVYQIFLIENDSILHRTFYIIYAIGQCFLEVGALMLLGSYLVKRLPKILNPLFIVLTFVLFMIHIVDFPLVRLFDWSIWYVLDFVSAESYENFIEMLYASNVSLQTWLIAGIIALLLPMLGVVFFRMTNVIAKNRTPYEFFLHNGQSKCILRFFNQRDIFQSRALQVLSKRNIKDEPIAFELPSIKNEFKQAFEYLFVAE